MRMFFPLAFYEQSGFLNGPCAVPGSMQLHTVWCTSPGGPRPMAGLRCCNGRTIYIPNIVRETVCTSLFPHTPIFFTLSFTLCQMINNSATIPGRKAHCSLQCVFAIQDD